MSGRRPRRTPPETFTGVPSGATAVRATLFPSRTRQRSAASLSETRNRYGPRVKGVSEGPRRYDIQYQIVTPTAITQTATIRPSAASASRARVSRRWRISSLAIPAR